MSSKPRPDLTEPENDEQDTPIKPEYPAEADQDSAYSEDTTSDGAEDVEEFEIRQRKAPCSESPRPASRPTYLVPKKNIRRPTGELSSSSRSSSSSAASSSRLERMKRYVASADEKIEDMLERLVNNVHEKAESAAQKSSAMVHDASEMMHNAMQKIKDWQAIHFDMLPAWMRDNDFLHSGHRPELPSFSECFRSIFRLHTETGNIWTHLLGFIAFIIAMVVFYVKPFCDQCHKDIHVSDKLIFLFFFIGAILCLACSTLFHTLSCHSPYISSFFSRLDYCGIALLIVGSVIPWLYYGFYCQFYTKLTYMIGVGLLGLATIVVVMTEKFNQPEYRVMRAIVFVSLSFLSALPAIHFIIQYGFMNAIQAASLHYMVIMGALYLTGALLYATRIPERFLPGKCDYLFQSHQIFHLLVVAAAFVHYHGITEMALHRLVHGDSCPSYLPTGGAVID